MMLSWFERRISHIRVWKTPYLDSSEEFWAMRESVTQRIDGAEEGYGSCKCCILAKIMLIC